MRYLLPLLGVLWAQTLPESDCVNAIPVCQQTYTYTNSPPDFGQQQELNNNTCLLNNEQKTAWFIFTVQQGGTFGFTINTTYDYDFALWDITNSSCSVVGNSQPIRCNFSAENGNTGLDPNQTDPNPLSYPASDPPFMPGLQVSAGQTFVLLIDNYTRDQTGFTITFNGTAIIFDNTPPQLVSARQDCQRANRIILRFNEPISCSTVAPNGSDFQISGGLVPTAAGCVGGGTFSYEVFIDLQGPVSSGNYTITLVSGSDGNTVSDKCGNFAASGQNTQVTLVGTPAITITPPVICAGGSVQLTGSMLGGLPPGATATWSTGATGLSTTHTPPAPLDFEEPFWYKYTLTVSVGACAYTLTDSVQVHPVPKAEITPVRVYTCGGRPVELTGLASILGGQWEVRQGGTWVSIPSPVRLAVGQHTLRYVSPAGCPSDSITVEVLAGDALAGSCNVQYVTPNGSPTAPGTRNAPTSLEAALERIRCRTGIIKLAQGLYILDRPLTTLTDSVILEGGYDPNAGWQKSSSPGLTTLRRSSRNIEGCLSRTPRLVALQIHGARAFRLQDLTIEVEDAPAANSTCADGRGVSTYGLYLRDCASYEVVRCQVIAGDASKGQDGQAGQNGRPGGNGSCGGAGAAATPTFGICLPPLGTPPPASAGAGGAGGSSPIGASGGAGGSSQFTANGLGGQPGQGPSGGAGGTAGSLCSIGLIGGGACACSQTPLPGVPQAAGGNGTDGANGRNGTDGADGGPGQVVEGFWRPGSRGKPGENGTHGSGGGGGGGGGGAINIVPPSCPTIGAGGGGGGGGGEGGTGGGGASGGGSSYAAVLLGSASGSWIQCLLSAGNAGAGGIGGVGGLGGSGGQGAGPCPPTDGGCNMGAGGKGGNGGRGGNGGSGGNGQPGQALPLLVQGTPPTLLETSFNLSAQPSITIGSTNCTGTALSISSLSPGSFTDLGAGANPPALPTNSGSVQYTLTGPKDITFSGSSYPRFWTILTSPDLINLRVLTAADTLCAGEIVAVSSELFALAYQWQAEYGGQIIATGNRDTFRFTAAQSGRYTLKLRVETDCCGWIGPVEKAVEVIPAPVIRAEGASGCLPLRLQAELVSGAAGGTFIWYDSNGDSVGSGAELILSGPVLSSPYTVVYRVGACASSAVQVTAQGLPTPILTGITANPALTPPPQGPVEISFLATYNAPAGYAVQFLWSFGDGTTASTTAPVASHLYLPGSYILTLVADIQGCRDTLTLRVIVSGQRQLIIPNAFSPNGDGINDVWFPQGAGIQSVQLRIYDRWGKLMYQGNSPWRGENAVEGVYTYVAEVTFIDGTQIERAGTLTLLR
ncbi:MAG: gliding motility-associated C-terminal domain-containing protein [Bacteroidia bacterium]|nr:gliding motility-associated C-terminal domain-containing protein [Bacteroidia bacterium]